MDAMKATDKWCPMANFQGYGNRPDEAGLSTCVAADCMMWRTTEDSKTDGYCGLAGKPE